MKTLPFQPTVSAHDGNTVLPSVTVPIMAGCQDPSSTTVPSTGMDIQYGPSDQTAQFGNNTMQLDVYWIQPTQLVPLDQQMLVPGPQFVQLPTATAGAPGQQARMLSPWHQPCGE